MDIRTEAQQAFERLPEWKRNLIGHDAAAVLRTAQNLRIKDGLIDGAIPAALKQHGITSRNDNEQQAYREFLTNAFLFGDEAIASRRAKKEKGAQQ